jgi:hypothetical protein
LSAPYHFWEYFMKNIIKFLGITTLAAVIGFSMAACDDGSNNGGGGGDDGGTYSRGDTGPGGGKIFWVSEGGFTVYMVDPAQNYTAHYLEAAPADMPTNLKWASSSYLSTRISELTSTLYSYDDFGYGRWNTAHILATDADAPAAKACSEYNGGGKNDWFLPSADELYYIKIFKDDIDNFDTLKTGGYWSSTQGGNSYAWAMNNVGGMSFYSKNSEYAVRAVRAF